MNKFLSFIFCISCIFSMNAQTYKEFIDLWGSEKNYIHYAIEMMDSEEIDALIGKAQDGIVYFKLTFADNTTIIIPVPVIDICNVEDFK